MFLKTLWVKAFELAFSILEYAICNALCLDAIGEIESPSFLGQQATDTWINWKLSVGYDYGYIKITFIDYDIGCGSGSLLEIFSFSTSVKTYCNLNKPIVDLRSSGGILYARYFHKSFNENYFLEGFKAKYEIIRVLPPSDDVLEKIVIRRKFANCSLDDCFIPWTILDDYLSHELNSLTT